MWIFVIVLLVIAIAIIVSCISIVPQAHAYVIERLGAYPVAEHSAMMSRVSHSAGEPSA